MKLIRTWICKLQYDKVYLETLSILFTILLFSGCLLLLSYGAASIWTAPAIPQLKMPSGDENPLHRAINLHEEALIGSLYFVGVCIGPITSILADLLGRKWSLIITSIIELVTFLILAFAQNIYFFYFTRMVQGICLGFSLTVIPIFIGEITRDENRGKFTTFTSIFMILGDIYGYCLGSIFSIKYFTVLYAVPLVIAIPLLIFFVPESPIYLIITKKYSLGKRAFKKFHLISTTQAEEMVAQTELMVTEFRSTKTGIMGFLKERTIRKALLLGIGLSIIREANGLMVILSYFHTIFPEGEIPLSTNITSILMSIFQLIAVVVSTNFIDRFGRKILLLTSTGVVAFSLLCLGLYFQFPKYVKSWVPIASVIIFILGYGLGLGPVFFTILSEIFPPAFKTKSATTSVIITGVSCFTLTYTFPYLKYFLGLSYYFWIYLLVTLLGMAFIYFLVPETNGKTLLDIQNILNNKNSY